VIKLIVKLFTLFSVLKCLEDVEDISVSVVEDFLLVQWLVIDYGPRAAKHIQKTTVKPAGESRYQLIDYRSFAAVQPKCHWSLLRLPFGKPDRRQISRAGYFMPVRRA
jgi:hypothetical protein